MSTLLFSPFGVVVLTLAVTRNKGWLEVIEVRPFFNPHPPEQLTAQFMAILPHVPMPGSLCCPPGTDARLLSIRSDLAKFAPDTYEGNAYRQLMDKGLLPRVGDLALLRGVAECTPHDAISNRTRWWLQMLLLEYWIHFGAPDLSTSFLYVWHDIAFQCAGQSRTIGKLAWLGMQVMPYTMGDWLAARAGCVAIYVTNQPDGTIPVYGAPIREGIDLGSRLFYE